MADPVRNTIEERKASMKVPTYPTKVTEQSPIGDKASAPNGTYRPSGDQPESIPRAGGS